MSWRATETFHQICHLDRRQAGVIAPVDPSYSRPRIRLFVGIGGQHTKDDRHPVVKGHPRDPAADLGADVLKVGCLPSDHGAETDDGIITAGTRPAGRAHGSIECPRDEDQTKNLVPGPPLAPGGEGALLPPRPYLL